MFKDNEKKDEQARRLGTKVPTLRCSSLEILPPSTPDDITAILGKISGIDARLIFI